MDDFEAYLEASNDSEEMFQPRKPPKGASGSKHEPTGTAGRSNGAGRSALAASDSFARGSMGMSGSYSAASGGYGTSSPFATGRQRKEPAHGAAPRVGQEMARVVKKSCAMDLPPPLSIEKSRQRAAEASPPKAARVSRDSSGSSSVQGDPASPAGPVQSLFASYQKELLTLKDSAEELRKKQAEEEEAKRLEAERRKQEEEERARRAAEEQKREEEEEERKREEARREEARREEARQRKRQEEEQERAEQERRGEEERKREEEERHQREREHQEQERRTRDSEEQRVRREKERRSLEEEARRRKEEEEAQRQGEESARREEEENRRHDCERATQEDPTVDVRMSDGPETEERRDTCLVAVAGRQPQGEGCREEPSTSQLEVLHSREEERAEDKAKEIHRSEDELHKLYEEQRRKEAEEEKRRKQEELKRLYEQQQKQKAEEEARRREEEDRLEHDRRIQEEQEEDEARRRREEEARGKEEERTRHNLEQSTKNDADVKASWGHTKEDEGGEIHRRKEELHKFHEERRKEAEEDARQRAQEELKRLHENQRREAEEEARRREQEDRHRKREEEQSVLLEEQLRRRLEEEALRRREEDETQRRREKEALMTETESRRQHPERATGSDGGLEARPSYAKEDKDTEPHGNMEELHRLHEQQERKDAEEDGSRRPRPEDEARRMKQEGRWETHAQRIIMEEDNTAHGKRNATGARGGLPWTGALLPDSVQPDLEVAKAKASARGGSGVDVPVVWRAEVRAERGRLEALQAELTILRMKMALLEEYNADLAGAKSQAEAEAVKLDAEVMRMRLNCRKLEDAVAAGTTALNAKSSVIGDLERRLEAAERLSAKQAAHDAGEAAQATADRIDLLSRISVLELDCASLREERDTLREDLALATSVAPRRYPGADRVDGCSSDTAASQLRAELNMAESMLRSCEKENENIVQQNRQLRQAARLKREEVDGRQLQLVAELNAALASADTNPASMRRMAELERELVAVKERADEQARELERCRETKRQLERELLHGAPPSAPGAEKPCGQHLAELAAQRHSQAEVAELREKVRWYADSQREMEEDRRQVERLDEELRILRSENSELRRRPSTKEANRRVAELRKQVDELQECLRKRHPDSLLSLVKACEPPPEERRELRELRERVAELEGKIVERDTMYDRQVRSLRAQYDHLRDEYERRIEAGRAGVAHDGSTPATLRGAAPDREAILVARIKDLEKQVENIKSYYLTKLRKREPLVPAKPTRAVNSNLAQQREAELQLAIHERDLRIEELSRAVHLYECERNQHRLEAPASRPCSEHCGRARGMVPTLPAWTPALLRLFLASPEAMPLASLSAELRAMAHAARCSRYGEVASLARSLLAVINAEEAASGAHLTCRGADDLQLQLPPPLSNAVWNVARRLTIQVGSVATKASLCDQGSFRSGDCVVVGVVGAIAATQGFVEAVLGRLLFSQGGGGSSRPSHEAWGPDLSASVESLLPRLLLEHLREEIDLAGASHVGVILQDAEVHAGLDHKLPWGEFVEVLNRCGIGDAQVLAECKSAAHPDWSIAVGDLRRFLRTELDAAVHKSTYTGVLRTMARMRVPATSNEPPLASVLHSLDTEGHGFITRPEFIEALGAIRCALSHQELGQLATYFSPASDPHWVYYPLLLQSLIPTHAEVAATGVEAPTVPHGPDARWADPVSRETGLRPQWPSATVCLQGLTRNTDMESENCEFRERIRALQARCDENAELFSKTPVQAVRRLQGEVAMLENRLLEQQAALSTAARTLEITLRGELEVCRHDVATLRRTLESKDREVYRYKCELEEIIAELSALQRASTPGK